jgi:drug/metabolite transporter (DMT)-like permease
MSDRRRSVILLVGAVVLWSTSGLFIKLSTLNPLALAGGRSAITALVLLAWIGKPRFTWSMSQIGGALSMLLTFVLFVAATQLTSAANAILLQFTAPLYVALFGGWFLGERPKSYDWWTMAAIVAGMALFFGDALSRGGMLGNILAMCSGITLAWMTLFLRKERENSASTILLGNMLTALIGLPFLLLSPPQPVDWAILLFLGVFQLGIPFIMYSLSLRHLEAIEAILIQTLEPILNPIWVFLVVGERPGPLALLGGALVILAVALRALVASRQVTGDGGQVATTN